MDTNREYKQEPYFTKQALKDRGWPDQLIRDLLPKPAVRKNPYRKSQNMYLWKQSAVKEAERMEEFQKHLEMRSEYQKRAAKAIRTKESDMRKRLDMEIQNIQVIRMGMKAVKANTLYLKEKWYQSQGKPMTTVGANKETMRRWMVNYIRHNLTHYDERLYEARGKTGIRFAYPEYRRAVLKEIARVYPELRNECERQMREKRV